MHHLPRPEKLDGVAVANPVLDDIRSPAFTFLGICHIRERDIVSAVILCNGYLSVLD